MRDRWHSLPTLVVLVSAICLSPASVFSQVDPRIQEAARGPALLQIIKYEHSAVESSRNAQQKASHSFLLNDASERYAMVLNEHVGGVTPETRRDRSQPEVSEANKFGANIQWCEFDGDWAAAVEGYLDSLELDPAGPYAEEAWWRGRLGNSLVVCRDQEGSLEESQHWVNEYRAFLRRFPKGKHLREAREMLKQYEKQVRSFKPKSTVH